MRALLIGYYGQNNLGDDMMLVCLRKWLFAQGVTVLTVLSEVPDEMRQFGLPAIENVPLLGQWAWRYAWLRGAAPRVIRAVRRHDIIVVGGGDLIRQDCGWKQFIYAAEKIWLARLLRKPVYILNAGIGEPQTRFQARVLRATLRLARQIVVRDQRSVRACGPVPCSYAPDIVTELPAFIEPVLQQRPKALLVSLCSNSTRGRYELTGQRLANLAAVLDAFARAGQSVAFLPFHPEDEALHMQVFQRMRARDPVELLQWSGDIPNVAGHIACARLVIAMRLHAAVCAVALSRRCLTMPYDIKVEELAAGAGLPRLDAADLDDPALLAAAVENALHCHPPQPETWWSSGAMSLEYVHSTRL
jgi:polysaccharide pyruvyl transferase CsaB